jgi:hypothetical protein
MGDFRMKTRLMAVLLGIGLAALGQRSEAAVDRILEVVPGGLLANLKADGFKVWGTDGQESPAILSAIPSVALGLGIERDRGFIDLKCGAGMLVNSAFSSLGIYGGVGLSYEVQPSVVVGPHVTLNYYTAPDWWGDLDIGFSDTMGYTVGIHFNAGDRIAYLMSIDYFSAVFDVEDLPAGIRASSDELDMSGIAVQFGVIARF